MNILWFLEICIKLNDLLEIRSTVVIRSGGWFNYLSFGFFLLVEIRCDDIAIIKVELLKR